jgi:hypothetical protein
VHRVSNYSGLMDLQPRLNSGCVQFAAQEPTSTPQHINHLNHMTDAPKASTGHYLNLDIDCASQLAYKGMHAVSDCEPWQFL